MYKTKSNSESWIKIGTTGFHGGLIVKRNLCWEKFSLLLQRWNLYVTDEGRQFYQKNINFLIDVCGLGLIFSNGDALYYPLPWMSYDARHRNMVMVYALMVYANQYDMDLSKFLKRFEKREIFA